MFSPYSISFVSDFACTIDNCCECNCSIIGFNLHTTKDRKETDAPIIHDITMNEEIQEEDREFEEPQRPLDPP